MSDTQLQGDPAEEPETRPIRLVVTYRTGISLCVDARITPTQQQLLQLLSANADRPVSEDQLLQFYDAANRAASMAALSKDLTLLDSALAHLLAGGAIRRAPDGGYVLGTDKALISIPR